MSNACRRFRKLKNKTRLTYHQLAEIFGVEYETVNAWYLGLREMEPDCEATLARLEGDRPQLSPMVRRETAQAFYAGCKL